MRKNILLSVILISFSLFVVGQSQRLVFVEEATNASCGPCASQNPAFDALLQANSDKLVALKYHWYFPGYDPMYNHNQDENNSRVAYYGINGVPHALIDGTSITGSSYLGAPANCSQAKIDAAYAIPSPFEITISHEVNNGVIYVAMLVEATESVSGNLRARLAVVEDHIHFNSSPGSNGETDFYNVMKKMLPGPGGNTLNSSIEDGEYFLIQESWELANIYDMGQLGVVGFIQDNTSKGIHQGAKSSTDPITPLYSNDAEITEISNISVSNCVGRFDPVIVLRNNGSDVLTSANITYTINNEDPVTFQWTGNLAFLESETIALDEAVFTVLDENTVNFEIEEPNGIVDDYPANNIKSIEISKGIEAEETITLILKLDDNPEETTWEFTNSQGDVIHEGGPYSTPGQQIFEQYEFVTTDCYIFNIYDAAGNGLDGGTFAIGFGSTIIVQGSDFGSKDEGQFRVLFTGVDEIADNTGFSVYPNPVSNLAFVSLDLPGSENIDLNIYNSLGEVVYNISKTLSEGNHTLEINTSQFINGIYYINMNYGEKNYQEKIIVTK
ncbi:MAG: hypothetical protein DRJ05_09210 [Bacteroidetes bacterium]|nr:MAG: hypothetical protein DRJ05_09210 [Bacteroidota bacterium]